MRIIYLNRKTKRAPTAKARRLFICNLFVHSDFAARKEWRFSCEIALGSLPPSTETALGGGGATPCTDQWTIALPSR